ncbi:MAG: hypothetical protein Q9172_001900 [Xanthocarpia lactea]
MALLSGRHKRAQSTEIRDTASGLEYLIYADTWIPAVYHNDIRRRLIHEAAQNGTYQFQWGRGRQVDDVTAYMKEYRTWGPERVNRPKILFQYYPPDVASHPNYDPEDWYDGERIVLGPDNRPVRRWRHLPATISSRITGQEMEALLRLDRRSSMADLIARMPKIYQRANRVSATKPSFQPIYFRNKQRQARLEMCCRSWAMHQPKASKIDKGLEKYLLEHFKQFKTTNSVENFHDLSKKEQRIVREYGCDIASSHDTEMVEQGSIEQSSSPACRLEDKTWADESQAALLPKKLRKNDWRFKVPTSDAEACELRRALEPTVRDFQFWLNGYPAPHTADTRSYASRWHYIRERFEQLWVQHTPREVPTLRSLDWGGAASILDWRKGAGVDVPVLPDDGSDELMDSHSSVDEEVEEDTENGEEEEQEQEDQWN